MTYISPDFQSLEIQLKPFALKLTKDTNEAADLMQETFMKAIVHKKKFEEGTNYKAWLFTIMKNTFITQYQKANRRKTFCDSTDNDYYLNQASESIDNDAYTSFKRKDIFKALKSINKEYSTPFLMYFKGFKYHEIADMLELPIGTIKNRIHLARKELKDILKVYRD